MQKVENNLILMELELFIFDWSGVISDDRKPVYEANMKLLESHGKPRISFEEFLLGSTANVIEFLRSHGIDGDSEELFSLYKKSLDAVIKSGMTPEIYLDVYDVINYLMDKRKKLAVLSSHPSDNLIREAEDYNLKIFFDLMIGSSRDKVDGLKSICEKLEERVESSLYVGDTIYDVRVAKKAGVSSAAICTGYHDRKRLTTESPDYLLETLSDIKNLINPSSS